MLKDVVVNLNNILNSANPDYHLEYDAIRECVYVFERHQKLSYKDEYERSIDFGALMDICTYLPKFFN